ncbi:hypothetical protein glysoja_027152 [Glycine soja]|uniref:Uncharacterized protein n=1 Tax=Glycine soja TaxID=3848 RepID=A0A0B2Q3I2_GLYSO|nr:hypothetical protein glysoja_027152 [Glycine soja]
MGSLFQLCFFGVEGHHHPHSASAQSATLRRRFPSLPQSSFITILDVVGNYRQMQLMQSPTRRLLKP